MLQKQSRGVAGIVLYLGIGSVVGLLAGGGHGDPPPPLDVANKILDHEINLNSLSTTII